MSESNKGQRLGRGLSALLGEAEETTLAPAQKGGASTVPIENVYRNKDQPRTHFDEAALADLAESIRQKGVLQPLIVRPIPGGDGYQIVAGERRWRAAQKAGLHEIPVLVRDLSDREVMEIALVENIQRSDLDVVDEARAYKALIDQFHHTQEDIARAVGKSRPVIANALRILSLPDEILDMVRQKKLSAGHARALVLVSDPLSLAQQVAARGLSVRQLEELARQQSTAPERKGRKTAPKDSADTDVLALEESLTRKLGLAVLVRSQAGGGGSVQIKYKTLEQLDDICRRLTGEGA